MRNWVCMVYRKSLLYHCNFFLKSKLHVREKFHLKKEKVQKTKSVSDSCSQVIDGMADLKK